MAGLLNPQDTQGQAAPAQDASAESLQDPILQQIERGIEEQVPPNLKAGYNAIVNSGMELMFNQKTAQLMDQQLDASGDIVANVSDGIAKLMMILFNESKGQMSIPAIGLASVTLMCQALDYAEKTRGIQVDEDMVAQATQATTMKVLEKFGITRDKVQQVIAAGQQAGGGGEAPAQGGAQPQQMGV